MLKSTRKHWRPKTRLSRAIVGAIALCLNVSDAHAHEGPPFPIVQDYRLGDYNISVWADPDIGDATFYIQVESPERKQPTTLPSVSVWTEPVSGRLERVTYAATKDDGSGPVQFTAHPHFDQRDMWNIGIQLTTAQGESSEWTTEIESTPPGFLGIWDIALYAFPFLLLGVLWMVAMIRGRRASCDDGSITAD